MSNKPRARGGARPAAPVPEGFSPVVTCTEHVRSNLLVGIEVEVVGALVAAFCLLPVWGASWVLALLRYLLLAIVAASMAMGVVQILGYFNKRVEMDAGGLVYTSSTRRSEHHPWSDVVAYDTREDMNSLELVFCGRKRRTFHKTSENYEQMVDYVIDHTELVSVK
ncbi:MAG: hypothetical protein SOH58_06190 [Olsenella sp.]